MTETTERCAIRVFDRLTGIVGLAELLIVAAMMVMATGSASAQSGFVLTTPNEGSLVPAGQPVTVEWTGTGANPDVDLVLIDQARFAVFHGFGTTPNTGSRVVTIPMIEGENGTCGRQFRFYIEDVPRTTWTYGPIFTVVCRVAVAIDIKPGSFPNSVNLSSGGVTPVAVLGTATLDVNDIDVGTLSLGTAGVKTVGKTNRYMCSVSDVSGDFSGGLEGAPDGFADLVCQFETMNIVPEEGDTTARVMGNFAGGVGFEGVDSVNIVP